MEVLQRERVGQSLGLELVRDLTESKTAKAMVARFDKLVEFGAKCRQKLREEMQIEFTLMDGELRVLDAVRAPRSARVARARRRA